MTLYDDVTAKILAKLEAGVKPWVKPWNSTEIGLPYNIATGKAYSGVNIPILWMAETAKQYSSTGWLTYKQAQAIGAQVNRGEKATCICYFQRVERENKNGESETFPMLKTYSVFNREQIENLPEKYEPQAPALPTNTANALPHVDAAIMATGARIHNKGNRAYYAPSQDIIVLPAMADFPRTVDYYATAWHELGHWTGAETRCARNLKGTFGTASYAQEELVAELTAAYCLASLGVSGDVQHAEYIGHWITLLKSDNRAFFKAASAASKAHSYLMPTAISDAQAA